MTELQEMFLFGTFIYYLFKGSLFVVLYIALVIVKNTLENSKNKFRRICAKRGLGTDRWKVAYNLCEKQSEQQAALRQQSPLGYPN